VQHHVSGLASFGIVFVLVGLAGWGIRRRRRVICLPGAQQGGGHPHPLAMIIGIVAGVSLAAAVAGRHEITAAAPAARPAPAPARTVTITHTITRVVAAHPWLTGTEFVWLCVGLGVLAVGATAIVVTRLL